LGGVLVVLLLVIGFPIALVIAWAFELRPEGLKRTEFADKLPKKSSTLSEWRQKYTGLNDRIDKAREIAREKLLKIIKVAAVEDWRAAVELLKLTHPNDYRRPGQTGSTNTYNTQINTAVTLTEEQQERMAQRAAELRAQWKRITATTLTPAQRQQRESSVIDAEIVAPEPEQQPVEATTAEPEQQPEGDSGSLRSWWDSAQPTNTEDVEPANNGVRRML
jgi:hypothetical protein